MVRLEIKGIPVQLLSGLYIVPICSKRTWDKLKQCRTRAGYEEAAGSLLPEVSLSSHENILLVTAYIGGMEKIFGELGLELPSYPVKAESDDIKYTVYTRPDKLAADYAGLDIYAIDEIPVTDYMLILRDAFILRLSQTESGRKYLNDAYRLTQTDADDYREGDIYEY